MGPAEWEESRCPTRCGSSRAAPEFLDAHAARRESAQFPVAAATAHICASRRYVFAAAETIQVHGGSGFTWEHPAHLYFRRAKSAELLFGGSAVCHERFLRQLEISAS